MSSNDVAESACRMASRVLADEQAEIRIGVAVFLVFAKKPVDVQDPELCGRQGFVSFQCQGDSGLAGLDISTDVRCNIGLWSQFIAGIALSLKSYSEA